jgi:hypothetical protein
MPACHAGLRLFWLGPAFLDIKLISFIAGHGAL